MIDKRFNRLPDEMLTAMTVLKELHGAPEEISLPTALSIMNSAAMHRYNVNSRKYGVRPISLFMLAMAATGGGKSTIHRELASSLKKFQEEKRTLATQERQRYDAEKAVYDNRIKKYQKLIKEANEDDDDDYVIVPNLTPPKEPRPMETYSLMLKKATLNGLYDTLLTQSYAWMASTEGGESFSSHAFQGKDASKAIELTTSLTALWDGDNLDKNTGMTKSVITDRRVNMFFLLQKAVVEDVLKNRTFQEQGFTNRWLITDAPAYQRPEWDTSAEAEAEEAKLRELLKPFNDRIEQMLMVPAVRKESNWDYFALDFTTLDFEPQAHKLMVDTLYNKYRNGEEILQQFEGFCERLHEHGIRVAATLAAFKGESTISYETAQGAIDIMEYFIEQRDRLEVGARDMNPDHTFAVANLTAWMLKKGWAGTETQLRQFGPNWFRKLGPEQRAKILTDSVFNGDVTVEQIESPNNHKTMVVYKVASESEIAGEIAVEPSNTKTPDAI